MKYFVWFLALALGLGLTAPVQAQTAALGIIEGSLAYPSEFIPPDMTICAENIASKERICTAQHIKGKQFQHGAGYRLKVPPGEYHVYAYLPDPGKYGADYPRDYRAYYSEFVKCGMQEGCPSHAPVVVRVKSGDHLKKIDPQDWYKK
jgi:hypothetical protein